MNISWILLLVNDINIWDLFYLKKCINSRDIFIFYVLHVSQGKENFSETNCYVGEQEGWGRRKICEFTYCFSQLEDSFSLSNF